MVRSDDQSIAAIDGTAAAAQYYTIACHVIFRSYLCPGILCWLIIILGTSLMSTT